MQAIGRKGGSVTPQTRLRKAADDDLREQARETLSRALRGEDVPKAALDAARSLFSYRADAPPAERQANGEYNGQRFADGRRPTGLADVLEFAVQLGQVAERPELVEACRRVVAAADGGSKVSERWNDASLTGTTGIDRDSGDPATEPIRPGVERAGGG